MTRSKTIFAAAMDAIDDIVGAVSATISSITGYVTKYPIPLGLIVYAAFLFYRKFSRNPFKLSIEKLKEHVAEARVEEERLSRELKAVEKVVEKVAAGEIKEGDKDLLDARRKQLEEAVKLARTKVRLASMMIMIKENMDLFYRLFGRSNFEKLLDVEELSKRVDKELKGMEEVDVEALYQYFNNVFPLILKEPERFEVKEEKPAQPPPPPRPERVPLEQVDKMLREGSVEEWMDLIKKAVDGGEKIKIPPGRYAGKEGYRNLLKALYIMLEGTSAAKLREAIEDRFITRAVECLSQLRSVAVEVRPDSSDKEYMDEALQIMCGNPIKEESTEAEAVKRYMLALRGGEGLFIERRAVKDPVTKRAQKITYKVVA
jgi:hypothetical protein